MKNYQFNGRIIKYVSRDILALYARFGLNDFIRSDVEGKVDTVYSIKKLTNEAMISKVGKNKDNVLVYRLTKHIVDVCQSYEERHA